MNTQQLQELTKDEGLGLKVYDDATGVPVVPGSTLIGHPTIGYGRALDVQGITTPEAQQLLAADILRIQRDLAKQPWYNELDEVRQGVITNLAYNMGVRGVLAFRKMVAALKVKDYNEAANQLTDSKWFHQVQKSRSSRLIQQLRTGVL